MQVGPDHQATLPDDHRSSPPIRGDELLPEEDAVLSVRKHLTICGETCKENPTSWWLFGRTERREMVDEYDVSHVIVFMPYWDSAVITTQRYWGSADLGTKGTGECTVVFDDGDRLVCSLRVVKTCLLKLWQDLSSRFLSINTTNGRFRAKVVGMDAFRSLLYIVDAAQPDNGNVWRLRLDRIKKGRPIL